MSVAPNSSIKTSIKTEQNALNQRVAKLVDGEVVAKYLWADLTTLLAIYDKDDNLKQRFAYANGRMPVSMTSNGEKYYLHYDQVGSLRAVSDASHNIVKEIVYDTYGNILSDSNPTFSVPFGFAGGLYDADTKLTRFGYRDYDAYTGKWTAKDPIGFSGGDSNLYGYVLGDPVDWIDIDGLSFSNGYEERIWVKPEDNSKSPLWVYPGEYYPYGIDGYQPPFWDGDWLKVPTGISCSVDDKGQNDRWRDENLNWKDYLKSWTPDIDFIDRFPGRKNKDYYKKYPGWKNP